MDITAIMGMGGITEDIMEDIMGITEDTTEDTTAAIMGDTVGIMDTMDITAMTTEEEE